MNDAGAIADDSNRALALDTARSFIVQAPAGSGKTELLLQRYLALLSGVAQPEAIVAMTFTRKAAGEIRSRILDALRTAGGLAPTEPQRALSWRLARTVLERDRSLGWNLVAHPARMQVHTIDALCVTLMRQAPLAVQLGALPRLTERAEPMYAAAARAEINAADGQDQAWRCLLDYLDNDADRLAGLIAGLLGKREQWLRHLVTDDAAALRSALEATLRAVIEAELGALRALLPHATARALASQLRYAAGNLARQDAGHALAACLQHDALPPAEREALPHWRAIAGWLLTRKGTLRRSVNKQHGFPPAGSPEGERHKREMEDLLASLAAIPGFAEALHFVRHLPPPRYDNAAWLFIQALLTVLPRVAARLQLVFAQTNAIDFSAATLIALRALENSDAPSDLLLALDARMEHLLVDEFQDTSQSQCDLIAYLTAGWTPGDGRTLFLVGDPMQSIYRFRDAEVRLFVEAQERRQIGSIRLEALTLSRNFRAQRGLVEWVNRTFGGLPARIAPGRGAVAFKAAVAVLGPGPEPAVTLDLRADAAQEAAVVVSRIAAALATEAKEIAVLVRRRADLAQILPLLRGAGIAYAAVELDRLSERQAVLDIASLAHGLLQPDDRAAWLAMLRAPWCGLSLPDLFAIAAACAGGLLCEAVSGVRREDAVGRLSADGRPRFERFAAVVGPALAQRGRMPVVALVRGAWLALGGPACVAEPIDLAAAQRVFSLLHEHSLGADVPDWAGFSAALHALYADPPADAATRVRVMTLHRAKGLEFDVVLMPGLGRRPPRAAGQLLLWRQAAAGLLLAPIRARNMGGSADDPVYAYLRALGAVEEQAELDRLLYVGCTRARQKLHLSATLDVETGAEGQAQWKAPVRGSSLSALWSRVQDLVATPPAVAARPLAHVATGAVALQRLPLAWRLPPPAVELASPPEAQTAGEALEFDWVRETARRIGTVAHRYLRRIGEDGLAAWPPERVAAQRARVEREFNAHGFTPAEAGTAADQVLRALQTTLADGRGRWLFDPAHTDAHSEWALTHWRDGTFVHQVLDRTFVTADGKRWIIDFKLSPHLGGSAATFLDQERERYRPQLDAYAAALRALDARPIHLGLYFPLLAGWREWTGSQ